MDVAITYDLSTIHAGTIVRLTAELPSPPHEGIPEDIRRSAHESPITCEWNSEYNGSWLTDKTPCGCRPGNPYKHDEPPGARSTCIYWDTSGLLGEYSIKFKAERYTGVTVAHDTIDPLFEGIDKATDFVTFRPFNGAKNGPTFPQVLRCSSNPLHLLNYRRIREGEGANRKLIVQFGDASNGPREFTIDAKGRVSEIYHGDIRLVVEPRPLQRGDTVPIAGTVTLQKTTAHEKVRALWAAIKERTRAIGFEEYTRFVDDIFGNREHTSDREPVCAAIDCAEYRRGSDVDRARRIHLPQGVAGYDLLKTATQLFLLLECGIVLHGKRDRSGPPQDENGIDTELWDPADPNRPKTLVEAQQKLSSYVTGIPGGWIEKIKDRFHSLSDGWLRLELREHCPCMQELIWNYWMEEAGLVQALKAIGLRFQNRRYPGKQQDPLIEMEITPLRRINNLLWGYIQDDSQLLSVQRRAYEYDHHYGITLLGPVVPNLQPVDSRSKFIEAFHYLLCHSYRFIQEQADKTVDPDPFPLLSDLREVHLLLTEGAHNQYGDLPWQSRVEFLLMQYLLSLPDMREFLRSRAMVKYPEEWMGPLDAMNRLQGWSDVSCIQYYYLATYGERLLLSIRHNNWMDAQNPEDARDWLQSWSQEIQGYIHAYRAVTGADLTLPEHIDTTMPALLLRDRRRERTGRSAPSARSQIARR